MNTYVDGLLQIRCSDAISHVNSGNLSIVGESNHGVLRGGRKIKSASLRQINETM